MIYITASTGVFAYNPENKTTTQVMSNKYRPGFFRKKSHGYFGICHDTKHNRVIVASREKLGTPKADKPTTDAGLHAIDPVTNTFQTLGYVMDVHDVHQIDIHDDVVFLTDTGKNRVIGYNLRSNNISSTINFGQAREDIHHINAVTIHGEQMLVGLNNRGEKASEILSLPLSLVMQQSLIDDAFEHATEIKSLAPHTNTHDIEPYKNTLLVSSSHKSMVIDSSTSQPLITGENWLRGLTHDNQYLWVGQSHYAKRARRHSKSLDGTMLKIDSNSLQITDIITIPGTGQINDLQYVMVD
jgi:hypothetical protein